MNTYNAPVASTCETDDCSHCFTNTHILSDPVPLYSFVMNLGIKLTSALYIYICIVNKGMAHHYPVAHC